MILRAFLLIVLCAVCVVSAAAQSDSKGEPVPLSLSPVMDLRAETKDGQTAEASYRLPSGKGPFPAIIFIHGTLNTSKQSARHNTLTKSPTHNRFLAMGFVIVQSTFRTYIENPQDQGPVLDNLAVIQAVRDLEEVDPESIVVMGGSGGGSIAMDLITRTRLSAAIAGEPASIIFAGMLNVNATDQEDRFASMNDPQKYYTSEIQELVQKKVRQFTTPLLILHGDVHPIKDVNMDYIIPEIRKLEKPLKVIIYPGQPHGFYWGAKPDAKVFNSMMDDIQMFVSPKLKTQPKEWIAGN
ncbi:MAG: prolyl oligopeptidase family serine peptidase [Verrucomicrobia bacterium]|nr:prolyl oligopeptidase family serine peptidase [Verrucomicrobiota bacterium]